MSGSLRSRRAESSSQVAVPRTTAKMETVILPTPVQRFARRRMMSSIPLPTLPSRLHPRGIVFGNGHHFEFFPGGNRVCTAVAFLICEELSDEVDVTIVRYLLELFDSVEGDVLLDEVAIRRVISFDDLLFSPAVQTIPNTRLLVNVGGHVSGLANYKVFGLAIACVVFDL